ncbi:MAG: DDE-type integrase/transposase/recombinase [Bacteroidota bacterium]|jgi:putative transposase
MSLGLKRAQVLTITGLSKHQLYYRPKQSKRTFEVSQKTRFLPIGSETQIEVENSQVVERITDIQADADLRCGYEKMTCQLQMFGFYINKKKVYRLMEENSLLYACHRPSILRTQYARNRVLNPSGPLELIEMDIKQFWIERDRKPVYVLSAIDTFTRVVLAKKVGFMMKSAQVAELWAEIMENHLEPHGMRGKEIKIEVRSDNGPQFKSAIIQEFFKENELLQVFTHPYTPQENGHIESFHSILSNAVTERFWTLEDLETRLNTFYETYNERRVHHGTALLPPKVFWKAWEQQLVAQKEKKTRHGNRFYLKKTRAEIRNIMFRTEHLA